MRICAQKAIWSSCATHASLRHVCEHKLTRMQLSKASAMVRSRAKGLDMSFWRLNGGTINFPQETAEICVWYERDTVEGEAALGRASLCSLDVIVGIWFCFCEVTHWRGQEERYGLDHDLWISAGLAPVQVRLTEKKARLCKMLNPKTPKNFINKLQEQIAEAYRQNHV